MILYLMRHAEAVDGSDSLPDEFRYLTEKGRLVAARISSAIARSGPKPRLTITSPLTRAVQTAEIMAANACRKNVVVASPMLLPGADIGGLVAQIRASGAKRLLLVGHEPQLGTLLASLLDCKDQALPLKKAACVALEFDPEKHDQPASFLWRLEPDKKQKKVTSVKKAFPKA